MIGEEVAGRTLEAFHRPPSEVTTTTRPTRTIIAHWRLLSGVVLNVAVLDRRSQVACIVRPDVPVLSAPHHAKSGRAVKWDINS